MLVFHSRTAVFIGLRAGLDFSLGLLPLQCFSTSQLDTFAQFLFSVLSSSGFRFTLLLGDNSLYFFNFLRK